jgi:hypothetical protein
LEHLPAKARPEFDPGMAAGSLKKMRSATESPGQVECRALVAAENLAIAKLA